MTEPDPPSGDEALSNLRRRVDAARASKAPAPAADTSAASLAVRYGGEFGAAIIVGFLIGFGADALLHSGPWGLIVGLSLGFVAGVTNVVRVAQSYARQHPVDPATPAVPDDAESD